MNKLIKKIVAIGTTLTVAVMLLGPALPVKSATAEEIEELGAQLEELLAKVTVVKAQLAELRGGVAIEGVPADFTFDEDLGLGSSGDAVKYLQIILNSDTETQLAESGVGSAGEETEYFGPLTEAAVKKFQEKYADEVLASWGLTSGTGYVGSTTRDKLNSLLAAAEEEEEEEEEKAASEITDPTECVTAEYEWYDEACHEKAAEKKAASEITDAVECVTADYEWYGEACHEVGEEKVTAEGITDPIECVTSGYEWYSDSCHEVGLEAGLLTVTRAVEPRSQKVVIGGDAIPALGLDLEVENNEVTITSIELIIYKGTTPIDDNDEVSAISIYDEDRVIVAKPISEDIEDGLLGFYGLEEKITKDTTETWVIKVDIVEDEDLKEEYKVAVEVSGIGFTDPLSDREHAGLGTGGEINKGGDARYITVKLLSTGIGALKVSKDTDLNPEDRSVEVGEDGEDEVTVLAFGIEETTENEAVTIENLNITAASSKDLDISLYVDDTYVDEISVSGIADTDTFEDIDVEIPAGESKTFEVKVDFPGIDDATTYTVKVDLAKFDEAKDLTSDVSEEIDEKIKVTGTLPISGSILTAHQELVYPKISDVWTIPDGEKIVGGGIKDTKMMSFTVTAIGDEISWASGSILDADTYASKRDDVEPQSGYYGLIKIEDVTNGEKTDVSSNVVRNYCPECDVEEVAAYTDYDADDLTRYYANYLEITIAEGESRDFEVFVDGGLLTAGYSGPFPGLPSDDGTEWYLENVHYALIIYGFDHITDPEVWWCKDNTPEDANFESLVSGEVIFNYVVDETM